MATMDWVIQQATLSGESEMTMRGGGRSETWNRVREVTGH